MKRSMAIGAALVCALATADVSWAQSLELDRLGFQISFRSGAANATLWEVERADARLHGARRAHQEARWHLDQALARQHAAGRDLAAIEHRIAQSPPATEWELRRLDEQLEVAHADARRIEADVTRLSSLAAEAHRAAEAIREQFLRQAESGASFVEARAQVDRAQGELDVAARWVLDRQHETFEWRRTLGWREEVAGRLAEAERTGARGYEIERLRGDLSQVESRLAAMEGQAISHDPAARDAQARLTAAQRGLDELWRLAEGDLQRDPAYGPARDQALRADRDAAQARRSFDDVQGHITRLQQEVDRASNSIAEAQELQRQAVTVRFTLDCAVLDVAAADDCFRRAEHEVHAAQFAYDAALTIHQRCLEEERRHHDRDRVTHRDSGHRDDHGRDDPRSHRRDADDRDDRGRGDSSRDGSAQERDERSRDENQADTRRGSGPAADGYRDRGERYERARQEESGRQRTRG